MHYLHATFCTWVLAQTGINKRGKGQEFRKVLLIYSFMHMTEMLNASKAHICYFPIRLHSTWPLVPPLLLARVQVSELWSYGKYCEECKEGLRRNLFTLGEKKVSYISFYGALREHKQNMCLPFLQCNCTIALLEEQDVLQDSKILSLFSHKSHGQTSANHSPLRNNRCFTLVNHYRQYSRVLEVWFACGSKLLWMWALLIMNLKIYKLEN